MGASYSTLAIFWLSLLTWTGAEAAISDAPEEKTAGGNMPGGMGGMDF